MSLIQVDGRVRLMLDLPDLGLHRGDMGIVCSTWFDPITAYEVRFQRNTPDCVIHTLLMLDQIMRDPEGEAKDTQCPGETFRPAERHAPEGFG
ncbi:MAG: hypothetical protein ACHRHE_09080 [Tepidisphaerales bacterium]